jgi:hypothetical protein
VLILPPSRNIFVLGSEILKVAINMLLIVVRMLRYTGMESHHNAKLLISAMFVFYVV